MVRPFGVVRLLVIGAVLLTTVACAALQSPLGAIGQARIQDRQGISDTVESSGSQEINGFQDLAGLPETEVPASVQGSDHLLDVPGDTGLSSSVVVAPEELEPVRGSSRKVTQLTGDFDYTLGEPTLSQTGARFGLWATDLGSSLEHKGKLYFLFGDSWGQPGDLDAVAWTESHHPAQIRLDFHQGQNGKWLPPSLPGITQGAFEIPSGGVSIDDTMYVVFTTDHSPLQVMGRSVLAASADDGQTFTPLYQLSQDKFINVSFWLADDWLYLYGSGEYRQSSVYLARVKPSEVAERGQWRYFSGVDGAGQPHWSAQEAAAVALFQHPVVGEFSVAYLEPVKRHVMLYNSREPRGITLRWAQTPWGPWSAGTVVWEPWQDQGYGSFLHIAAQHRGPSDGFSDPQREQEWGGEYGPYLMSRFTQGTGGWCRIYYTMSTWNPYQVVVMQTDLRLIPHSS